MSIPAPFEVIPAEGGFTWSIIGPCGRVLVYTQETYPTDFAAAEAAKQSRALFSEIAASIDECCAR